MKFFAKINFSSKVYNIFELKNNMNEIVIRQKREETIPFLFLQVIWFGFNPKNWCLAHPYNGQTLFLRGKEKHTNLCFISREIQNLSLIS